MTKKQFIFVPIFLSLLLIISSFSSLINISNNISKNILRIHIIANSDSVVDQQIKLVIRDIIVENTNDLFSNCKNISEAVNTMSNNKSINDCINNYLRENKIPYSSYLTVKKEYFKTRYYESFTLPAGYYNSIFIKLGEAKGHNWWCVAYPSVCLGGAIDNFDNVLTIDEEELITNKKYIPKLKIVEIYYDIKNKFSLDKE